MNELEEIEVRVIMVQRVSSNIMKHLQLTNKFCEFWEGFSTIEKIVLDPSEKKISEALFYHIFKIKQSLWKHGENFNRKKRTAISDLLQDILAYYLKATLSDDFEVILEEKVERIQVDILVKYKQKNLFVIEVKTSLGWDRNSLNGEIENRIEIISNHFKIDKENVVYIFQTPWNINASFRKKYWDLELGVPANQQLEFPFNKIRPLFFGEDPFYFKDEHKRYFTDEEILLMAKSRIVIPYEITINEIQTAANILCKPGGSANNEQRYIHKCVTVSGNLKPSIIGSPNTN